MLQRLSASRTISLVAQDLRRCWHLVAGAVLLGVLRAACWVAVVVLVRDLLAGALNAADHGEQHTDTLAVFAVGTLLLYILASALAYASTRAQHRAAKLVESELLEVVTEQLLLLSLPYIQTQSHGDLVDAVRNDIIAVRGVVLAGIQVLVEGALAAGILFALVGLSPTLTLYCLLVLPAALLPTVLLGRRLLRTSQEARSSRFRLFDTLMEILRGIRTIEGYGQKERAVRLGLTSGTRALEDQHTVLRDRALAQSIFEALGGLSMVLAIALGGYSVLRGELDAPSLVAFLVALRSVHRPLDIINQRWVMVESSMPSVRRLDDLLERTPEITSAPDAQPLPEPPRRIQFQKVSVTLGGKQVLRECSFEVRRGERTGIVGPSGAGKTTLLNLMARLIDPTAGAILLDGMDLRRLRLEDVREKMAYVTQIPFVFTATVAQNIAYGRPGASAEQIHEAADRALIHHEITALSEGYETNIGVGGQGLSTGQLQRICLARAFLKSPPMILLDEATAAIDFSNEKVVQEAIDNLSRDRTVVAATHRLASVREYDRIIVVAAGKVEASGTHEELLEQSATYGKLWEGVQG